MGRRLLRELHRVVISPYLSPHLLAIPPYISLYLSASSCRRTQYSSQCTRLEPVVVVPIKDHVLQAAATRTSQSPATSTSTRHSAPRALLQGATARSPTLTLALALALPLALALALALTPTPTPTPTPTLTRTRARTRTRWGESARPRLSGRARQHGARHSGYEFSRAGGARRGGGGRGRRPDWSVPSDISALEVTPLCNL